ncbi:pro-resilin-like [Neodiprion fabricii]|uniref:pro-resilin-like n=1 Tax=Neodiprion fabricii TaxID=2872261 RepID=UPI001ED8C44C|nr:pro-resilin-like [Neodiprion fabricii]
MHRRLEPGYKTVTANRAAAVLKVRLGAHTLEPADHFRSHNSDPPARHRTIFLLPLLVAVLAVPQGPAYLPPTGNSPGRPAAGHPDEWAGDPANYEFSYEVQDAASGLDFGHREMRKDDEATGSYHVLLPDGRTQIVDYVADGGGYRPMVRYEGTASFPAPGGQSGSGEGYRY